MTDWILQSTGVGPCDVTTKQNMQVPEGDQFAFFTDTVNHADQFAPKLSRFDTHRAAAERTHREFVEIIYHTYIKSLKNEE